MSNRKGTGFVGVFEDIVFKGRVFLLIILLAFTGFMAYQAATLFNVDAGFEKGVPLGHPFMGTYLDYKGEPQKDCKGVQVVEGTKRAFLEDYREFYYEQEAVRKALKAGEITEAEANSQIAAIENSDGMKELREETTILANEIYRTCEDEGIAARELGAFGLRDPKASEKAKEQAKRRKWFQGFRRDGKFGGSNSVLIALMQDDGSEIYQKDFIKALYDATTIVSTKIDGVDPSQVSSLHTPSTRYIELVEGGLKGGPVIPGAYDINNPDPAFFPQIKDNVIKSGVVGRLVANNHTGAMINASLIEINPRTQEKIDYAKVGRQIEDLIRDPIEKEYNGKITVHVIGFAKVVQDIVDALVAVVGFFGITILMALVLLILYTGSFKLSILPIITGIVAVIWQFGLLMSFGFGLDPMGILVPFLVFAIGVSHGVQMINSFMEQVIEPGATSEDAARVTFARLLVPASVALVTDTAGFATILLIPIGTIFEMGLSATIGVAVILVINLLLMPILLSYVKMGNIDAYAKKVKAREGFGQGLWRGLSSLTDRGPATVVVLVSAALFVFGTWYGNKVAIGDLEEGVPELKPTSTFNLDAKRITAEFEIGVDRIQVIVEAQRSANTRSDVMRVIDGLDWTMQNEPGVQSVISIASVTRLISRTFNDGNPKLKTLPRRASTIGGFANKVTESTGLTDKEWSAFVVMIFTKDHKAGTINHVVGKIQEYIKKNENPAVRMRLATGPVGVMAATNDVVEEKQLPIVFWVYGIIVVLCMLMFLVQFRSISLAVMSTICVVAPLALVSALGYAVMVVLGIGLKVSTLPVVALGVGIGVDYGVYIFGTMGNFFNEGKSLKESYLETLQMTGKAVLFTAVTLGAGVATWMASDLQFQIDMGKMLSYMFIVNMLAAVVVLPALAHFLVGPLLKRRQAKA